MNTQVKTISGQCLCGAVTLEVKPKDMRVGACHCDLCRRWSGGPFFEIECDDAVAITGEGFISTFPSSDWAERGFCKSCGTHLFIRVLPDNAFGLPAGYGVPPGLFADSMELDFHLQVFIDRKPAYYSFANATSDISSGDIHELFPLLKE